LKIVINSCFVDYGMPLLVFCLNAVA